MKFGIAKLPKTFYKNTERKFKRKKSNNNNKALSSIENRKVNTNPSYDGRKSFVTWQIQCRHYWRLGRPCLFLVLLKYVFCDII